MSPVGIRPAVRIVYKAFLRTFDALEPRPRLALALALEAEHGLPEGAVGERLAAGFEKFVLLGIAHDVALIFGLLRQMPLTPSCRVRAE
jgi:hypothetical protein